MHYADQLTGAYEEDLTRASGGVFKQIVPRKEIVGKNAASTLI